MRSEDVWSPRILRRLQISIPTVGSIAILAGSCAVVIGMVAAILWRPLPAPDADRLVAFGIRRAGRQPQVFPYAAAAPWARSARAFDAIALLLSKTDRLDVGTESLPSTTAAMVSGPFFQMLAARASHGRLPDGSGFQEAVPVVVASGTARRLFGSPAGAVGKRGHFAGVPIEVVGCLDRSFDEWRQPYQLWIPLAAAGGLVTQEELTDPLLFGATGVARLRPGRGLQDARTDVGRLISDLRAMSPGEPSDYEPDVRSLRSVALSGASLSLLWVALAVVCVAFVVGTANAAHLLLADCARRREEFAIRASVGASRSDLGRLLLEEGAVLAAAAAAVGGALAIAGGSALNDRLAGILQVSSVPPWNAIILLAVMGLSIASFVAIAMLQGAFVLARPTRSSRRHAWTRLGLIASEVAIATAGAVVAIALVTSIHRLARIDLGFDPSGVYAVKVRYPEGVADATVVRRLLQDASAALAPLGARPALASDLPLEGKSRRTSVWIEGKDALLKSENPEDCPLIHAVSSGYFRTLRIPLVAGRTFEPADDTGRLSVIVNRRLAQMQWPGENPIGKRLRLNPRGEWHQVVGVVEDMQTTGIETSREPELFMPAWVPLKTVVFVLARSSQTGALVKALRESARWADPLPLTVSLEAIRQRHLAPMRVALTLLGVAGAVVLVLVSVGVYGTTSFLLRGRSKERAIRLAVGGSPWEVTFDLLRRLLVAIVCGAAAGLALGFDFTVSLERILSGTGRATLGTLALAAVSVLTVSALAWALAYRSFSSRDLAAPLREL